MDWTDIAVKIGVGACLGFGIIVLSKLARKKNDQDHTTSHSTPAVKQHANGRVDTRHNE